MSSRVMVPEPLSSSGDSGPFSWKGFCCGKFGPFHFLLLALLVGVTYGVQFIVPAFRADDIIQLQPASNDSQMFLILGRWGYYWIFEQVLDTSSGGIAAGFLGLIIQIYAAILVAKVIGLKSGGAVFFFSALATISVLFAYLFSFDSTRLAYPIGNLLAAGGLYLSFRKHPFLGLLCFAASPGFYQASIQFAIAGALGASLKNVLEDARGFDLAGLVRYAVLIFLGLVLYLVGTQVVYGLLQVDLARSEMELATLLSVENWQRFVRLFSDWSMPFVSGYREEYFSNWIVLPSAVALLGFLYFIGLRTFCRGKLARGLYAIALLLVLLVSPFLLALAAPLREDFPPRTLFVFGLVYGVILALPMERLCTLWREIERERYDGVFRRISLGLGLVGGFILSGHMLAANEYAVDDYLTSQADLMAVNRIIAHIESIGVENGVDFSRPVPIYAYPKTPWRNAGPRGDLPSARHPDHARSWIFSFVDFRFDPIFGWDDRAEESRLKELAKERPVWPHPDSVFVSKGAVVVVF